MIAHNKKMLVAVVASFILAAFCLAEAQQASKALPRIGFISPSGAPGSASPLFDALRQGLSDLGYVDGKNIILESRNAEGRLDRMPALMNELVQQKVDVIVAVNNVLIRAAKEATKTLPIVMVTSVDPVDAGYVNNFAHPGGNITGIANLGRDLSAKRVQLLKEVLPKMSRLSVLWDANAPGPAIAFKEYEAAARAFKLDLRSVEVHGPNPDLVGAFQAAKTARAEALIVIGNPLMVQHAKQVFELAAKYRLPSMTEEGRYVDAGGLISYGANLADLVRRAAEYVVDILKGAKPGDLPVKVASKFEIFINLKTAKQIGVVMPQHVLVQADKVIQ
ncbi:MAG TPA: ABC transporter substrate-binding protein [Candidatus Binatia bacterium]|jgi:putative ABC transport system substrate-binding protein|nr:ABC transporter substrate-binding protein [Candidatus Binatia bacterium]